MTKFTKRLLIFLVTFVSLMVMFGNASALTEISSCDTLNIPGETYVLSSDIIASGTCFRIGADGITLDGNGHTITGSSSGYGVYFRGKTAVTIENLDVSNFYYGIVLDEASNNQVVNNILSENVRGIYLFWDSDNNQISNNILSDNGYGISLDYFSSNNQIENNIVSENKHGILLYYGSNNNNLTCNTIESNTGSSHTLPYPGGISLASSSNNQIYNNNFIDNSFQAQNYWGSGNIFNLDKPIGGNYWSDSITTDDDHDGFVDSPYPFPGGVDNLPHTSPIICDLGEEPKVEATVDVKPDTLNKKSKSSKNAVTVYIELPDHDIEAINVSTVTLSTDTRSVSAQLTPTDIGDYDSDGIPDLMVKFDRQEVIDIVEVGDMVKLDVIGQFNDSTWFEGSDTIRVISKGK